MEVENRISVVLKKIFLKLHCALLRELHFEEEGFITPHINNKSSYLAKPTVCTSNFDNNWQRWWKKLLDNI